MTQTDAHDFRIESTTADPTLADGIAARVADPAWMLARQWQFGEFAGEDAGSPANAMIWTETSGLTRFLPRRPDGTEGATLERDGPPVEALAENEWQPRLQPSPRFGALAGLQFLRMMTTAGQRAAAEAYRQRFPLARRGLVQGDDDPLLLLARGRALDGQALFGELDRLRSDNPPVLPPVVEGVARRWLAWYDGVSGRTLVDAPAWVPGRLEYQLSLAGPTVGGELVLSADQYDSGELDWFDFDVMPDASLGAGTLPAPAETPPHRTFLPAPATFHGMPAPRWWEFEDATVDFGAAQAGPEDVATMLVVEFALRYGNDFFVVPLPLTVGGITRVGALVVTDTFGRHTLVRPASAIDAEFGLFEHTVAGTEAVDPALVVLPVAEGVLESPPVEEVALLRDEAGNVCWASEQRALGPTGVPVDRAAEWARRQPAPSPPASTATEGLRYLIRGAVPDHWFPLLPAVAGDPAATAPNLRLGQVRPLPGEPPRSPPWGRVLTEMAGATVPAEEVTRTGRTVVRTWQFARGPDGTQYLWCGRRAHPVAKVASPALRFDQATETR